MSLANARKIIRKAKESNSCELYLHYENLADDDLFKLLPEIKELKNLRLFSLINNKLSNVECLKELNTLTSISLNCNRLSNVDFLKELKHLSSLSLFSNRLTDADFLKALRNLSSLDIGNNKLTNIDSLRELKKLKFLNLIGNQTLEKIIGKGILVDTNKPQAILNRYFEIRDAQLLEERDKSQQFFEINEAKMILIGQGFVGKTSLRKCLIDGICDDNELKTEGLEVKSWLIDFKDDRKVTLKVWDFGGQEVYHASHKFFVRNHCLFVLVLDVGDRTENNTNKFKYWLKTIESLMVDNESKKAPVIIVCNKAEKHLEHFEKKNLTESEKQDEIKKLLTEFIVIDKGKDIVVFLNQTFKKIEVKGVYATSCKEKKIIGVDLVKNAIINELEGLGVSEKETKTFIEDKVRVENYPKNYIKKKEFANVCPERTKDRIYQFSRFGIITTFEEDNDELRDLIILKPKWLTESIYKILSSTHILGDTKGIAGKAVIKQILSKSKKTEDDEVDEVIKLMENFGLCAIKEKNEYFFPSFFSNEKPNFSLIKKKSVCYRYIFTLLPDNFITQFLSKVLVNPAYEKEYWRTGVFLTYDQTRACIEADMEKDSIIIEVEGRFKERNKLVNEIKSFIHEILLKNKNLNLEKIEVSVPKYVEKCIRQWGIIETLEYKMLPIEELKKLLHEKIYVYQVAGVGLCNISYLLHEEKENKYSKKVINKDSSRKIAETIIYNYSYGDFMSKTTIKDNKNVGNINTGIQIGNTITTNIGTIKKTNDNLAEAFSEIKDCIETFNNDQTKSEALEQLEILTNQAVLPANERKIGLIKPILFALATGYQHFANFASIWGTFGDAICNFFGIDNPIKTP